ncbi:MAG: signal peptidase I [Gammaproteobacteria bacterium]|nr:MAG: signal peptidase I [Gammaproteobacteria bacterium]
MSSTTLKHVWEIPRVKFTVKASSITLVLLALCTCFFSKYTIGIDSQDIKCIKNYSIFLVEKKLERLERGEIYSFKTKDLSPFYKQGTIFTKIIMGVPGDTITVDEQDKIFVNGVMVGEGLMYAESKLKQRKEKFRGTQILGKDKYWMMGDNRFSFDSRYWGTVDAKDFVGRSHPIF